MFSNMTVAKTMALLIVSAALGLVGLTGLGIYQMDRIYTAANFANDDTVPAILVIDEAFTAMALVRSQVLQHVAEIEDVKKAELDQKIVENRQKIDVALKKYEPM